MTPDQNKALALEAFDTLFNQRDYVAAEKFWSPNYMQHSAHIPAGRDGLFGLIKSMPPTLHGRFSGIGQPADWIVADVVRIEDGRLAEHWDVVEDEATREASVSGLPMFGAVFPNAPLT